MKNQQPNRRFKEDLRSRDNRIIPNVRAKTSNYDEGKSEEDMKEELYSFGEKGKHTIDDIPVDITQNIVKHGPEPGPCLTIFKTLLKNVD